MYVFVMGIKFPSFYNFSILSWNCSNCVVFFYLIVELFQLCGIFLFYRGTIPTVWYFSILSWNCSNCVVFFYFIVELFQLCGIFCFSFYDPIFIQRDSKNEYFVLCALNALLFSVPC